MLFREHYPISGLQRLSRDEDGVQADFVTTIDGIRSFAQLRAQSDLVEIGGYPLLVASLRLWFRANEPLGGPKVESDRALVETIRRLLDKPMQERTQFPRKRIGFRGSCL